MWSALGLLVVFIIPGVFSHGFKKKQIQTDDILLDGRIYRQVGEYETDGYTEPNLEEEAKVHPLQRLLKSVMGFWKGKKLKNHHQNKHGEFMDKNEKTLELKLVETFNFHPQFQWQNERNQFPKFKGNPTAYKPKYSFKSKEEKFFEQNSKKIKSSRSQN